MRTLTPIERAIAGEPASRQRRWEQNMAKRGYRRMTLYVRERQVPVVEALKLALREMDTETVNYFQESFGSWFEAIAEGIEYDLEQFPNLADETSVKLDIAVYRAAAAACSHTERSEGGNTGCRPRGDA